MTRFFLFLCLLSVALPSFSQHEYSYISDRRFFEPSDLVGYQFVPIAVEIPGQYETDLSPGEYSFGISSNNLYVVGDEIKGVFNINTINTTEFGFKLDLINARNPTMQGHLKVIRTKSNHVEALVFKRSKTESEMVFFLPQTSPEEKETRKAYFTDYGELDLPHLDNIWGYEIIPFFRIDNQRKTQQRLTPEDSVHISFVKEVEIIEKVKKGKSKATKKDKRKATEEEIVEETEEMEEEEMEALEEEIEEVEESSLEVDEAAIPPITEEMVEEAPKVKTKIIKRYFVIVKSLMNYDDGTSEMKAMKIPIQKVIEKEDDTAGPGEERFQIAMESEKGKSLYIYMTENRKITAFEMGSLRYELRN